MASLWVVGPIAWDWVLRVARLPRSGEFVQAQSASGRPGGAGANVAIALASTPAAVRLVGYVGGDEVGARLLEVLKASQVDVGHVARVAGGTSQVLIFVEPSGERTIVGVWPDHLAEVPVPVGEIQAGEVVYFAAWHLEFVAAMTELGRRGAMVATVPPQGTWASLPARWVIGSEAQFGPSGDGDPEAGIRRCAGLVATGALEGLVVTRGARGATAYTRQGRLDQPATPVEAVDATGAGDAFAAGFLRHVADGCPLAQALQAGLRWGAAAVTVPQSIPPPWPAVDL